jgi:hypothetical protein
MLVELTKIDGQVVGYTIAAETEQDKLVLGSIRNMQFWGFDDTALEYAGVESEDKEEGSYALKMHYIQKKHSSNKILNCIV